MWRTPKPWKRPRTGSKRELGPIDVWVNVAMATVFAPVHKLTAEEFQRGTAVTYLGQVHGTMAALKYMRPRNRGSIVSVGSALAYRSVPLQSVYCGAKFAIRGFLDALRSELYHDKIKVTLTEVDLPAVNTPQFDWARNKMGRKAQPVPPIFQPEVRGARDLFRRVQPAPPDLGRLSRRSRRSWPTGSRRGCSTAISRSPATPASSPTSRRTRMPPATCSSR